MIVIPPFDSTIVGDNAMLVAPIATVVGLTRGPTGIDNWVVIGPEKRALLVPIIKSYPPYIV